MYILLDGCYYEGGRRARVGEGGGGYSLRVYFSVGDWLILGDGEDSPEMASESFYEFQSEELLDNEWIERNGRTYKAMSWGNNGTYK